MMNTRREFLQIGTLAALGAAAGCKTAPRGGLAVNGVRIGVQMWSVDDLWKGNPAEAFRRLKAMGYDGVQSEGFYFMKPDELEALLGDFGLQMVDMPFEEEFVTPPRSTSTLSSARGSRSTSCSTRRRRQRRWMNGAGTRIGSAGLERSSGPTAYASDTTTTSMSSRTVSTGSARLKY